MLSSFTRMPKNSQLDGLLYRISVKSQSRPFHITDRKRTSPAMMRRMFSTAKRGLLKHTNARYRSVGGHIKSAL
jgi:hypothetical protein